jgi:predicted nucleotidyltransferase
MGLTDKHTILQTLADHHQQLKDYGVIKIGLFGSFVRNEASTSSDIDLLVDIEKDKKTFRNFMSLSYYLEDLLQHKVDLVTLQSLSPYIGPHILKATEYASFAS